VAIRPEEIAIGNGPDGANTIVGRVDNVEYGGRDSLVDVTTRSGVLLHVRSPKRVTIGEEVPVHVPTERALVYPTDRAS
jgi:putative spermidine/putrescine transport system ATP-binding protein